ncbi:MAG: DUF2585 family protein [Bauldia sp.]|uniref:DUF2585 family protein n=1 Tax=Bauldia sp. TaxID=2575872 RepID=UPI001D5633D1|nr:DUF2585 family protein [Bauldia sp.]MCB1497185.1 DUF2585 family protein [Bauldia sp.]
MSGAVGDGRRRILTFLGGVAVFAVTAAVLAAFGQPWIAPDGTVTLWGMGGTTSQQFFDWYTLSHILHGFLFYFALWLVARRQPLGVRALVALAVEAGWEILENTPWIIDRYRDVTVSGDYVGDTILNSMSDILAMLVGFFLAARLPVRMTVVIAIVMELVAAWVIRDNLTLNVIMLIYPLDGILAWQQGG